MNVAVETGGRWQRLKAATSATHDRLDKRIMSAGAFADRARYGRFVQMQHAFHREIDALYSNPQLDALLPDLQGRRRFGHVSQDLTDLGLEPLAETTPWGFGTEADIPTALGWLYVAEGSNLGAAFLIKEAQKLGLSETFGARHLAGAPEGRGLQWRTFTAALDSIEIDEAEEARVIAGAEAAFTRVRALADQVFS
ncbi:heme oxygenase [Terrihabitans soli]|uniref:Heme oxygenase n=1 Tax=Terrihabitans soli TaxID=708113 RepID=A0A6S6QJ23_9HYPH|nr:biliverdin-producing heme oxygenase [Terrihabitans soli]BCJ91253.1 heme oxygenase [Terrihabitans soli]